MSPLAAYLTEGLFPGPYVYQKYFAGCIYSDALMWVCLAD